MGIPGYVREVEYLESFDRPRPRGYRLVVVDEIARHAARSDTWHAWRPATPGRRCRYLVAVNGNHTGTTCKRPAVAELNRSSDPAHERWWGYCDNPDHLFGRVWDAEHQRLLATVLVPESEQP